MSRARVTVFIVLAVLVAAGIFFWRGGDGKQAGVVRVARGAAVELVYATGVIEPVVMADVSPDVGGRLLERLVEEGATVKAGDPLARLFDAEQAADVSELSARVAHDETALGRAEDLWRRRVGSQEAYDDARSRLEQSRAQLAAARVRLDQRTIRAPFDGVVLRRDGEPGEMIVAGQRLFVIARVRPLRATIEVDEEDIPLVHPGQKVLLSNDGFPGQVFTGEVSEVTPLGDSMNKTYRVRSAVSDDVPFPAGMTVESNIVVREKSGVLLVPSAALQAGRVFRPDGTPVSVETGIRGAEMTEVVAGVSEGEDILRQAPAVANAAEP